MNKKLIISLSLILVASAVIIGVLIQTGKQGAVVLIGAISPFSGEGANYGKAARTGIDTALKEINSQGGINGKRLEVLYEDDKGTPKDAVSAFQKLATVDKVPAILGPFYSSNVLACAPIANREKVILLTPTATSDNIRNAGDFVFRVCPTNEEQSRTIAQFAIRNLNLKSSYILYRNADYGLTLRNAFQKSFESFGGTVQGSEAIEAESTDVRAQLTKVKAATPDLIFAAVHYPEGSAVLRQAKELGVSAIIIGTDGGFDPELLKRAGDASEGSYWVTIGWGDISYNSSIENFKKAYHDVYGDDPGVYSGLFYDAVHVLAKAMNSSVANQQDLQKSLLNTTYDGTTGITKFDAFGDVEKPYSIYRVENGEFKLVNPTG